MTAATRWLDVPCTEVGRRGEAAAGSPRRGLSLSRLATGQRPRNWRRALRRLGDGASGLPATPVTSSTITEVRIIYPDAWRRGASPCLARLLCRPAGPRRAQDQAVARPDC